MCIGGRHQVSLELGDVDVQGAVEAERRRERRYHLAEEAVPRGAKWMQIGQINMHTELKNSGERKQGLQVGVGGPLDILRVFIQIWNSDATEFRALQ